MTEKNIPDWLTKLIIIIALPTVSCSGFYSIDYLGVEHNSYIVPVILSYPVALLGFVGVVRSLYFVETSKVKLLFWCLCIIIPAMIHLVIRW